MLGCYNSGTTLLKNVLAQHPAIGVLPGEGIKLTDALPRPEGLGWQRMWCRCRDQVRLAPGPEAARRAERVKRHWSLFYGGQPVFLEKSIPHAANIPFFAAYFQPVSFIYLVRNGYAVAEGIRRKTQPGRYGNTQYAQGYPIGLCAEQWQTTDEVIRADCKGKGALLPVYYEALARDPLGELRRITDFLDLAPLDGQMVNRRWKVHGVDSEIRDMNAQSIERLSAADIAQINKVAAATLERHNYPLLGG